MPYAVHKVEVAWSTALTGAFTIGTSTIGGSDVIPGRFGPAAVTFTDETANVKSLSGTRGRDATLGSMNEGRCQIVFKDTTGRFNPENAASPLTGLLVPGRPVRVSATFAGITYGRFFGVIESLESHPKWEEREAILECVDLYEWLGVTFPVIASTGTTTVGTAIGLVLDEVGWSADNGRLLDAGSGIADFSADGTESALSLIEALLTVDMGALFVDGDGVVTYQERDTRWGPGSTVDTLSGSTLADLRPRVALEQIRNRARVTKEGSSQQERNDTTSQTTYGIRDHPAITSAYLVDDAQADNLAAFLVALQKDPRDPARQIAIPNSTTAAVTQQLTRELGDRVTVSETLGGSSFTGTIEGISWEAWGADRFQTTRFTVGKRSFGTFFIIDSSTIGGTDQIGY